MKIICDYPLPISEFAEFTGRGDGTVTELETCGAHLWRQHGILPRRIYVGALAMASLNQVILRAALPYFVTIDSFTRGTPSVKTARPLACDYCRSIVTTKFCVGCGAPSPGPKDDHGDMSWLNEYVTPTYRWRYDGSFTVITLSRYLADDAARLIFH
jgi:hypothetical protein